MKCFREGCKREVLSLCSNNQCEYHHIDLCINKDYGLTIGGFHDQRECKFRKMLGIRK